MTATATGAMHARPEPTIIEEEDAGAAGTLPPADLGILVPATALSLVAWLVPLGARLARRTPPLTANVRRATRRMGESDACRHRSSP